MTVVEFHKHQDPAAILKFLRGYLPASLHIYHRIQAPQNTPERHTLLLATFAPDFAPESSSSSATVCFADRSRPNESQVWVFNPLCLQATQPEDLPQEQHELLIQHLRQLLHTIKRIGDSYATAKQKPLNYPFIPFLKLASVPELLTTILLRDILGDLSPLSYSMWDQLLFSTQEVKQKNIMSRGLPEGYEWGTVPREEINLVVSTSTVKRVAETLLTQPNVAIFTTGDRKMVAWAYLGLQKTLNTLYVLPEHRGRGLAKLAAARLIVDLHDGSAGEEKAQSDWCFAEVAADNSESQRVCKSLGARFHGRAAYMTIDLGRVVQSLIVQSR
ncbi:hypothetical protein VTN31DRAFT_4655 [Thermomyces dupontii]|uniref:uncharacterized protein n=1 Tax=Talaromyces thermophilus TaxID=28565 RepID=UPI0037430634